MVRERRGGSSPTLPFPSILLLVLLLVLFFFLLLLLLSTSK